MKECLLGGIGLIGIIGSSIIGHSTCCWIGYSTCYRGSPRFGGANLLATGKVTRVHERVYVPLITVTVALVVIAVVIVAVTVQGQILTPRGSFFPSGSGCGSFSFSVLAGSWGSFKTW